MDAAALVKSQETALEDAEPRTLRISRGVTTLDKVENRFIRGTAHIPPLASKIKRLGWYGYVRRNHGDYRLEDAMMMIPRRREMGRHFKRYLNVVSGYGIDRSR